LSTLDEDYRATLLLRLNGASYAEIAARLGVNEKTVATWIRRGTLELVRQVRHAWTSTGAVRDDRRSTMADVPDETIDRLLAGRASGRGAAPHRAGGARRSDLFEQLTAAGVVTNSVDDETRTAPPRPEQFQRRPRLAVDPPTSGRDDAGAGGGDRAGRRDRVVAKCTGPPATGKRRHGAGVPAAIAPPLLLTARVPMPRRRRHFEQRRARAAFPGRPERSSRCTTASSISIWGRSTD
jgi:hypothetical protein